VLWLCGHPGISTPESLRGFELSRILPSVLPVTDLHVLSCGFHRFEPVKWNGVATAPGNITYPTRNFARIIQTVSGSVGLYLEPLAIHLLCDFADTLHSITGQMITVIHQVDNFSKLDEIDSLA
jgi:hypothetical protein